ncbi:MAG: TlyA family RNA methyltransferase [Acidobacteriota bacterium]
MKIRADKLCVMRSLAETRERARALIMAGAIYSGEVRIDKAGQLLSDDAPLTRRSDPCPYVSRGGLKLEAALRHFSPPVEGVICADVGASTGGFTDCLLRRGAARVYAVDVGHGQLHYSLRNDPRVVLREGVNARFLPEDFFPEPIRLVVVDASFISLRLLLPAVRRSAPRAEILALVKPQFEAGRGSVGKGGVVRDPEVRARAVESIRTEAEELGYTAMGSLESPVKGPKGNVEFFLFLRPAHRPGEP